MLGDDLDPFFNPATFAKVATIKNGSNVIRTVNVVIDVDSNDLNVNDAKVEDSITVITAKTSDVTDVRHGICFEIEGKTYVVLHKEDSGIGISEIRTRRT